MTKPDKIDTQTQALAARPLWQRPEMRELRISATETGGASPQTDLGVTFS